jgi:hypothetical protein
LLQSQEAYESVIDGMLKFQMSGLKNNTWAFVKLIPKQRTEVISLFSNSPFNKNVWT